MDAHHYHAMEIIRNIEAKIVSMMLDMDHIIPHCSNFSIRRLHPCKSESLQLNVSEYINHANAIVATARAEMESDIDACFIPIRDWLERFATDVENCNNDKAATITACKALVGMFPHIDDGPREPSSDTLKKVQQSQSTTLNLLDKIRSFETDCMNVKQRLIDIANVFNEMRKTLNEMEQSLLKCLNDHRSVIDDAESLKRANVPHDVPSHADTQDHRDGDIVDIDTSCDVDHANAL